VSVADEAQTNIPLRVVTGGICCAVGFSAAASIAAIRAHINHFRETDFVDDAGEPINAAMLYEVPVWGEQRLQYMYRTVMSECLTVLPEDAPVPPIILIGAERERGARFARGMEMLFQNNLPAGGYDSRTQGIRRGKAGIAEALQKAREIFSAPDAPEYVIVAGIDSFLDAATIEHFVQAQRILCSTNPDGFIPGEAGAAIILSAKAGKDAALWIEGVGQAHEEASPEGGETPLRAQGLTQALRHAIEDAGSQIADYTFHASGVSGEQWHFKEASLAMDRVMTQRRAQFPHRLVCQYVGEVGAACGPLVLAWIGSEMGPDDVLGQRGLLHFANENGQRSALAVHYRK
jgi:3-oxoacyl-[acyl-carrier-protein] synthase-1